MPTDARTPYYAPPESNEYLDAEVARTDGDGKVIERQRTSDPESQRLLGLILGQLDDPTADSVLSVLKAIDATDFATEAKLEAVRALLAGTLSVSGTVTVANPTANPETGLAKDLTLTNGAVRGTVTVANPTANPETGLAKDATLTNGTVRGTVTVANPTANPETGLAKDATVGQRYAGGKSAATAAVTAAGATTVVTPAVGRRVRLYWVSAINDPDQGQSPRITIGFAGQPALYSAYALAHWEVFDGPVDAALVCTLDQSGDVAVTVHYQEL